MHLHTNPFARKSLGPNHLPTHQQIAAHHFAASISFPFAFVRCDLKRSSQFCQVPIKADKLDLSGSKIPKLHKKQKQTFCREIQFCQHLMQTLGQATPPSVQDLQTQSGLPASTGLLVWFQNSHKTLKKTFCSEIHFCQHLIPTQETNFYALSSTQDLLTQVQVFQPEQDFWSLAPKLACAGGKRMGGQSASARVLNPLHQQ